MFLVQWLGFEAGNHADNEVNGNRRQSYFVTLSIVLNMLDVELYRNFSSLLP